LHSNRKLKNYFALFILILYTCLSCVFGLYKEIKLFPDPLRNNEIGVQDNKWNSLRRFLPQRGVIGYLSDSTSHMEFILVQYSLAPLIVVNDTNRQYVIGNFNDPRSHLSLMRENLDLLRDFGQGVMLFKNRKFQ
jgi:hypothetical protein